MVNMNRKVRGLRSVLTKTVVSVGLTMLTLCVSFSVSAATENPEDVKGFLQSIGVEAKIKNEDAVTRGEFVELLGKAVKLDSGYMPQDDPFEDVYNYDLVATYVGPFKDRGVIQGDDGRFYPNRAISVREVGAFTARCLEDQRYVQGADIYECMSAARQSGFFDGVDENAATVTADDAYRIIYNYLNADQLGTRNLETKEQQEGNTALWRYHGLYRVDGVVQSNDITGLYTKNDADDEKIMIGDKTYRMEAAKARDLIGYRVLAFADRSMDEIRYVFAYNNTVKTITSEDEPSYQSFVIEYEDQNAKAKSVKLAKNFSFLYNGVAASFTEEKLIPPSSVTVDGQNLPAYGEVELIDRDDDGLYDTVKAWSYLYLYADSVKTDEWRLFDANNRAQSIYIDLENEDCVYDAYMSENGTLSAGMLESFTAGCAVRYAASEDGMYVKLIGGYTAVEGTAESKFSEGSDSIVVIDGTEYEVNGYFAKYYLDTMNLGQKCKFILDDRGQLMASATLTNVMRYGYLVAALRGSGLGADDVTVKILNSAGEYEILEVKSKILLDGNTVKENGTELSAVLFPAGKKPYQIVKYSVDEDGELNRLDTLTDNTGFVKYQEPKNIYDSLHSYWDGTLKYKTFGYFVPYALVSGATTFFFVPPTAKDGSKAIADEQFNVDTTSYFSGDRSYPVQIFDIDQSGMAKAVVVYQDASQKPINDLSSYAVVSEISEVVTEGGDLTKQIEYWQNGSYYRIPVDPDAGDSVKTKVENLKCGDLIRYSAKGDMLVNLMVDFSYENGQTDNTGSDDALFQIKYMTPYRVVGDMIYEGLGETKSMYKLSPNIHYIRYDVANKRLVNATVEDIKDATRYGSAGAKTVCAKMQYSVINTMIIFD